MHAYSASAAAPVPALAALSSTEHTLSQILSLHRYAAELQPVPAQCHCSAADLWLEAITRLRQTGLSPCWPRQNRQHSAPELAQELRERVKARQQRSGRLPVEGRLGEVAARVDDEARARRADWDCVYPQREDAACHSKPAWVCKTPGLQTAAYSRESHALAQRPIAKTTRIVIQHTAYPMMTLGERRTQPGARC